MQRLLLITGILLLFATEILRVYFIMPFPGSQHAHTIDLAYFIDHNRVWLRLIGAVLVAWSLFAWGRSTRKRSPGPKIVLAVVAAFYVIIFYFFNFRFEADKMFRQPGNKTFADAATNTISPNRLVIGVVIDHQARAYPIQLIGYHHQVKDTIGNTPVIITYCTVCRTGRVYSPLVNGRLEDFRLVGMDHFNAMFEDATTKSWWRQATGVAIAGPLKNARLTEIPSTQSTLAEWLREYPDSKILQPDTTYARHYAALAEYDSGTIGGSLEKRDSGSWKAKSWIVGVRCGGKEKAYDWNDLLTRRLIQDTVGDMPIAISMDTSSMAFHVWYRHIHDQTLQLERIPGVPLLEDSNTRTQWNLEGICVGGAWKGQRLQSVQSYQEFWHSWSYFHPQSTLYGIH